MVKKIVFLLILSTPLLSSCMLEDKKNRGYNPDPCLEFFSFNSKFDLCFQGLGTHSFNCKGSESSFEREKKFCIAKIDEVFKQKYKKHITNNYQLERFLNKHYETPKIPEISNYAEKEYQQNIVLKRDKIFNNYYKHCFEKLNYGFCEKYTNDIKRINQRLYIIFDEVEQQLEQKYQGYKNPYPYNGI